MEFEFWVNAFGLIARYAPLVGFLVAFTRVRLNWALRSYQIFLVLLPEFMLWLHLGGADLSGILDKVLLWVQLPFVVGSLMFLAVQWRRGNRDAALLLPSFLLANGIEILGLTVMNHSFHVGRRFTYDWDDLSMFFFLLSIAPVLLVRHRRISMEHARTSGELGAARAVQERLVPRALPTVSGYRLDVAYLPATEVGGDFYQVIEQGDGSLLIMVGDVSGKGLKAAMFGTLLVGAAGALAQEQLSPGNLLARLNGQLHGRLDGGFATCLCALVTADGRVTLANAGHLSPYCNGRELVLANELPLGLVATSDYEESAHILAPGERLLFLSDGVVEARNEERELFGFERTRALSSQEAHAIAEAAQRFGQDDDITVLTLERLEVAKPTGNALELAELPAQ
jgi:hypothetical protein